jgi:hypothetical protein
MKTVNINKQGQLIDEQNNILNPPTHWIFLPAGDAGVTRKVTSTGEYWKVVFKKGRRTMSKGVWAPAEIIEQAKQQMDKTRSTPEYQRKKAYDSQRREKQQQDYEIEFCREVEKFLNFHVSYHHIAKALAILVTRHAIPVGSGTVARTAMIPIEERASKAVIAWMRHQTTVYDNMQIPRIKGERRMVRRMLAEQSNLILNHYRQGKSIPINCPLKKALELQIQKN